ncbi:MAG: helix-turn-helix transcriptional regulator [Bacteroidales bacterium]|nr:helix-turn-helix transcriptional regulator [Bacteroidales bacterium]
MKDRIKKIIEHENISYSKFADLVGIQRSGVSHLINGRNNPSLEVIQKILEAFDYINTDWLLLDKGKMINDDKIETQGNLFSDTPNNEDVKLSDKILDDNNSNSEKNLTNDTVKNILIDSKEDKISTKQIVKIVIFYSDKTFSDFYPET